MKEINYLFERQNKIIYVFEFKSDFKNSFLNYKFHSSCQLQNDFKFRVILSNYRIHVKVV